ncbi:MAG: hypothetical protein M3083_24915 [Actinomycetota bacterium]|nr:hypothetical protein [Actinomycetota bacterium]MDQ6945872.1 hypothetical protein [Actinomycetota bacterium]
MWRAATDGGSWLRIRYAETDDWAEFVIDPLGTTVSVSHSEEVVWDELCELLLGPVFSCVLAQRGVTCVHAGVVKFDDHVVGFVGAKGAGKSTTSLAFVKHGAAVVSDDVAVLCELDGRPAVSIGAPRLRVGQHSAEVLCGSFDALEPMWAETTPRPVKRYLEVQAPPADAPLALDALYFLAPRHLIDQEPAIRPMPAVEAVPRLMANRHMVDLLERSAHQRDFAVLARVAAAVRICELLRPDGLHAMEQTVHAVLADLVAVAVA